MQASIDSARNIADEVKKSLDEELAGMEKTIDEAKKNTLESAAKALDQYFKEGKIDEEKRKEAASRRGKKPKRGKRQEKTDEAGDQNDSSDSLQGLWGMVKRIADRRARNDSESALDFDPDSPVIEFETTLKARKFMVKIQGSIEKILGDAQNQLSGDIGESLKRFSAGMKKQRDEAIAKVRDTLNQDLKDFEVEIRTPAL
mgnify:CR=1 FL=1